MSKKGSLSAALHQFDQGRTGPGTATQAESAPDTQPRPEGKRTREQGRTAAATNTTLPPSRRGKKALTGYFAPEALKQLRLMAVSEDTTTQALMAEALNDLFRKYGKSPIA